MYECIIIYIPAIGGQTSEELISLLSGKKRETSLFFSFAVLLLRMRGHELHFHFVHSEKWG